jgi:hypothetical protein
MDASVSMHRAVISLPAVVASILTACGCLMCVGAVEHVSHSFLPPTRPPHLQANLSFSSSPFFPPYLPQPPAWESLRMQTATLCLGPAALVGRLSMPGQSGTCCTLQRLSRSHLSVPLFTRR